MKRFFFISSLAVLQALVPHASALADCRSDRDRDHRPRVNCTAARVTSLPPGLDPGTQVILLHSNHFTGLGWSSYQIFREIYEIDLSANQVPSLSPSSGELLPTLRVLRLGYNRLTDLPDGSFAACPHLSELYLDNNAITSLSDGTFSGLAKLEILDLSSNHIKVLPRLLLRPLSVIETLYIENNKILEMPNDWFSAKPDIPYLYLSANPWACFCSLGYLHQYMDDYEHNVYVRDGPIITLDAESVVCDSPAALVGKPVVTLDQEDFCSTTVSRGDGGMATHTPARITTAAVIVTTTPVPETMSTMTWFLLTKTFEPEVHTLPPTVVTWSWYHSFTRVATQVKHVGSKVRGDDGPLSFTTATTPYGQGDGITTPANISVYLTTANSPTAVPMTTAATSTTTATTRASSKTTSMTTGTSSVTSTTTGTSSTTSMTTGTSSTTSMTTGTSSTTSTTTGTSSTTSKTASLKSTTTPATLGQATESSAVTAALRPGVVRIGRRGDGGAPVFCLWLFAGCTLLCALSAATTCATAALLARWCWRMRGRRGRGEGGLRLATFCTGRGPGGARGTAGKGGTAVYRSVLMVSRAGMTEGVAVGEEGRERVVIALQPAGSVGEGGGRATYTQSIHRTFSRQEEIEGWSVVAATETAGAAAERVPAGGAAGPPGRHRYSVILREEREELGGEGRRRGEVDWVVGGWEMVRGEGGADRSSWGEWMAHYLPSMPWSFTPPGRLRVGPAPSTPDSAPVVQQHHVT